MYNGDVVICIWEFSLNQLRMPNPLRPTLLVPAVSQQSYRLDDSLSVSVIHNVTTGPSSKVT